MSVDQIRAALDTIDATPRDGFLDGLEAQLVAAWTDDAELDVGEVPVGVDEAAPDPRHLRRRWMLVAAAAIVVLALGLLAVAAVREPDSIQTHTVPPTPAPSTNPATTTPLPPVDSSPATLPSTTTPAPSTTAVPVIEPAPLATPELFTDIAPDSMVNLPDAPILGRNNGAAVWTGTEMIVWSGSAYDPVTDSWPYLTDGAAFNLANGTWRVIAPAPLSGREEPAAVWTGTEMIVWGGYIGEELRTYDGAAYNPTTDTWRMLPALPFNMGAGINILSIVWTGNEAVVSGGVVTAAYDPGTDSWRRLADRAVHGFPFWTGNSIVWNDSDSLTRYDVATDNWTAVANSYAEVVGIPDADGTMSTFVALPRETGAPTQILDSELNPIGELPAFPGDPSLFGNTVGADAKWVGEEMIFTIWAGEFPYEPEQLWALNPTTQTWRQLDPAVPWGLVVAGDVMLAWGEQSGPAVVPFGVAYRSGTTPSDS